MRYLASLCIGTTALLLIASCGMSSYEQRGDAAYNRAQKLDGYEKNVQLKTAYIMYQKAIEAHPNKISAKLRTRFLDMALVRVKMVLNEGSAQMPAIPLFREEIDKHLAVEAVPEFKQKYAQFLVQLADSFAVKKQPEEALATIDQAIALAADPAPLTKRRTDLVTALVDENFDMAETEYANGKENKDPDALIRAEYYTLVTLLFDSTHAEAQKLLGALHKENVGTYSGYLKVIDPIPDTSIFRKVNKYDILLAVPAVSGGGSTLQISMYNYSYDPLRMKSEHFFIEDKEGKRYQATGGKIDPEILDQERETKFTLKFPKPAGEIAKLVYENGPHYSEKCFN